MHLVRTKKYNESIVRKDREGPSLTIGCSILFTGDHGLWVEEAAVLASAYLINHVRLEIDVDGTWNMFARRRFREKCAEAVIFRGGFCTFKAAIGLYPSYYTTRRNMTGKVARTLNPCSTV